MKKASMLTIVLIVLIIPFQTSCAQSSPCPANHETAEQKLKEYLSKEKNIKSLRDQYDMPIRDNAKDRIKSLAGEENKKECRKLISNLDWLKDEKHYSIYKVADHYFIVIYSFDENGTFQWNSTAIINSEYEGIGSIIDLG